MSSSVSVPMDAPNVTFGDGSVESLADVVSSFAVQRILVVASEGTLSRLDLAGLLSRSFDAFSGFGPNPTVSQVDAAVKFARTVEPELIVGVGGGSAMDVAKLANVLPYGWNLTGTASSSACVPLRESVEPLILVPTVSGSGSEVTRFATMFADGVKVSIDDPKLLATNSLVDPNLAKSCPEWVAKACLLDAIAHSIESYWSIRSNQASSRLALSALRRLVYAAERCKGRFDRFTRKEIAIGAIDAGRAIDITRTTAGHAFAYPLTMKYEVPHGVACCLNLIWLLDYVSESLDFMCIDSRGADFVRDRLLTIANALGATRLQSGSERLEHLVESLGVPSRLTEHGVKYEDVGDLMRAAVSSSRASNLPVRLELQRVAEMLTRRMS